MITVECLEGFCKGQSYEIGKTEISLGRSPDCDIWVDDSTCSRQHAAIEVRDGRYYLRDLGSTNGVLLNGAQIDDAELHYGDRFYIGKNAFLFLSSSALETHVLDYGTNEVISNMMTLNAVEQRLLQGQFSSSEAELGGGVSLEELEALRKANRQMRAIYSLSRVVSGSLGVNELYQVIVDNVFGHFEDVERVCIFDRDSESGEFCRVHGQSRREDNKDYPVSREVLEHVARERVGVLATDAMSDHRFEGSNTLFDIRVRSLMCVPLYTREKVLGAVYVENCTKPECFEDTDLELLTVYGHQVAMALENARLYEELERSFYQTVRSLSKALEAKDRYTRGHSGRVAFYAVGIGRELVLPEKQLEHLKIAAELHDIGKIAIPEHIINCGRKLTDEEYELVKKHPEHGYEILKPIRFLEPVLPIVLHHHERYNGKGYPAGLKGDGILLEARILNLADAFDAMTTQRPYNVPKTLSEAMTQCRSEAGVSFDAPCVEALCRFVRKRFSRRAEAQGETDDVRRSSRPSEMPDDTSLHRTNSYNVEEILKTLPRASYLEDEEEEAAAAARSSSKSSTETELDLETTV